MIRNLLETADSNLLMDAPEAFSELIMHAGRLKASASFRSWKLNQIH